MAYIYICNYNNYFNRRVKKIDTFGGYSDFAIYTESGNDVNFNPGDGVVTKYTAGRQSNSYSGSGDYLVFSVDGETVNSRWFIIDATRTRNGQYNLNLKRDVVTDNLDAVINSPMFIEKATVGSDSPFIYNKENFSCNQIKQDEKPLFDETGIAWIVGFVDRKGPTPDDGTHYKKITGTAEVVPDYTAASLTAWNKYNLLNTVWNVETSHCYYIYCVEVAGVNIRPYKIKITKTSITAEFSPIRRGFIVSFVGNVVDKLKKTANLFDTLEIYKNLYIDNISSYNEANYKESAALLYKTLKTDDGKSYTFSAESATDQKQTYNINEDKATGYLKTYLDNIVSTLVSGTIPVNSYEIEYTNYNIKVSATENQFFSWECNFPDGESRLHLKDAPFDMFIIPYGNIKIACAGHTFDMTKRSAMNIAQGIAQELGAFLKDIQIQPYCPASGFLIATNGISFNTTDTKRYTLVGSGDKYIGAMIWCTSSAGEKIINYHLPVNDIKVMNHCEKYRLSSGNHAAAFDFNPADNGGISGFKVVYNYLPINSYVRVAPIFGGLYGKELNDGRGMIQQGDYSITYINDTWVSYQNNNKNYINAFNRGIENLNIQRRYQRMEQILGGGVGAAGAGVNAATVFGGIAGAAAGVASAAGGVADLAISEKLYRENLSYRKDQFEYSLDNIRAMPNTIAKIVAYSADNKIVPILEIYKSTDAEILAFKNMLKYQGMTVGAIGKIADYLYNSYEDDLGFTRGTFLQLSGISDDSHMANAIAEELKTGVYFK